MIAAPEAKAVSGWGRSLVIPSTMALARFPFGRVDGRLDDQAGGVCALRGKRQVAG
jgi:hypothetical protein